MPLIWRDRPFGDCSAFPTRAGFADILAVFNKAAPQPAWTSAVFEKQGFMWFSLKDPTVLPTTVIWISNRGRHGAPWNGRNCCLGLEDVCAYFAEGLGPSVRRNPLNRAGVRTAVSLSRSRPTAINYIEGVVRVPRGFLRVRTAKFAAGEVSFFSETGKQVTAGVNHEFLNTGEVD